jgi:hypothetical protein
MSHIHGIIIVENITLGGAPTVHQPESTTAARFPNTVETMVAALEEAPDRDVLADRLQAMIAAGERVPQIARAAVEQLRYQGEIRHDIVDGQDGEDVCGCGDPVVRYEDEWFHVYNPRLTGTDDHDARPGR